VVQVNLVDRVPVPQVLPEDVTQFVCAVHAMQVAAVTPEAAV